MVAHSIYKLETKNLTWFNYYLCPR